MARTRSTRSLAGVLLLAAALAGCAEPEPAPPSFSAHLLPIVKARCVSCHYGDEADAGLDLAVDPWGAIVGVASTQAPMALVEPGDALYSYLWHKLNGSQALAGGSGSSMPQGTFLSDDEIALFAEWIDGGAEP